MMRCAALIFLMMCGIAAASAQSGNVTGFSDHRGVILPSVHFTDENGADVLLSQFFGRPFFLAFAYHSCPQLCGLVLGEFANALRGVSGHVGMDFDVIVISIDPADTPQSSVAAKQRYVARYGRRRTGWHFLTGDSASIRAAADAAGFNFVFDPIQKQFVHPAGVLFVRPGGIVAGHVEETKFSPADLQALIAGGGDAASSPWNRLCGAFGFGGGSRTPVAMTVLRIGAATAAFALLFTVIVLVRRRRTGAMSP